MLWQDAGANGPNPPFRRGETAAPRESGKSPPGKRKLVSDPIRRSRSRCVRGVIALGETATASASGGLCLGLDRMADSHSARGIGSTLSPMAVRLNKVLVIFRLRADSPCLWRNGVRSAIADCAVLSGGGAGESRSLFLYVAQPETASFCRRKSLIRLAGRLRRCRVIGSVWPI